MARGTALVLLTALLASPSALAGRPQPAEITRTDIEDAQKEWCQGLLDISQAKDHGLDPVEVAEDFLSTEYDYDQGTVLFKPTVATNPQFRTTKEGALSYFVGHDPMFLQDGKGFALKTTWVSCTPDVFEVMVHNDVAMAMGTVTLVDRDGETVTVDKSFGYVREPDGHLRIVLHHSSLPYVPKD